MTWYILYMTWYKRVWCCAQYRWQGLSKTQRVMFATCCQEHGMTNSKVLLCWTPSRAVKGKLCMRRVKRRFCGSGVIHR